MENRDENLKDSETVLLALDQISQTIDVMTSVIGRLRTHVQEQAASQQNELQAEMRSDRVLH